MQFTLHSTPSRPHGEWIFLISFVAGCLASSAQSPAIPSSALYVRMPTTTTTGVRQLVHLQRRVGGWLDGWLSIWRSIQRIANDYKSRHSNHFIAYKRTYLFLRSLGHQQQTGLGQIAITAQDFSMLNFSIISHQKIKRNYKSGGWEQNSAYHKLEHESFSL